MSKKISTQKVVGGNVPNDVPHVSLTCLSGCPSRVAQNVAQDRIDLAEFIKEKIRENNKITRKAIADEAGVSKKTIERAIKEIDNLKYVGRGNNGHWELNEQKQVLIHRIKR